MDIHAPHSLVLRGTRFAALALAACLLLASCSTLTRIGRFTGRNLTVLFSEPRPVPGKIERPYRADARLTSLWVGHATVLVQMDDKWVLTDPVFTPTVGQVSKRLVEPGLDSANLPTVDATLISHFHFDHLSLGTLEMIEKRVRRLFVPRGGLVYIPSFEIETEELAWWESWERDGMRVTAVPVKHLGWRYVGDRHWMTTTFTGYVVEYHGMTVYFGGDTAYDDRLFKEVGRRFPRIDLALLPIAPIEPRDFMQRVHVDPDEAVRAFLDLGARVMVPIHYDTFINSQDEPGDALRALEAAIRKHGVGRERVRVLGIGEQAVFLQRQ